MNLLAESGPLRAWRCVHDDVMGGRSTGHVTQNEAGHVHFQGTVSLENGGGFASVRSDAALDVASATGLLVRGYGPPRRYRLTLRTETAPRISYRLPFWTTPRPAWHYLPFARVRPMRRGQPRPDAPPFDATAICELGFLIGDKQEGDFVLHVMHLAVYNNGVGGQ